MREIVCVCVIEINITTVRELQCVCGCVLSLDALDIESIAISAVIVVSIVLLSFDFRLYMLSSLLFFWTFVTLLEGPD